MKAFEVEVVKKEKTSDGKEVEKSTKIPIKALKIEKGKGAGGEYYVPTTISSFNLDWLLSLYTEEELLAKLIRPKLKQFCATVTAEAAYDAGKRTPSEAKEEKVPVSGIQD